MSLSSEFLTLIENEIPEGRQSLLDSHANLEKVAAYCLENFARADNKKAALEETKNYTTQSLASVAYQINTLAYNFLQMIDQQTNQLAEVESEVNYISQMVMIHKEKVARREIGVLTTNKTTGRQYKILAPENAEKPIKYVRKPIDFHKLDNIGHGLAKEPTRTRSSVSFSGVTSTPSPPSSVIQPSNSAGPAPTTKPPTPPQANRSVSSLSRGSREYRTPPAVAPPLVPSNYAPNYPIGHPRRNEKPGYGTLPNNSDPSLKSPVEEVHPSMIMPPPQVGMVHPMAQMQSGYAPPPPSHMMENPGVGVLPQMMMMPPMSSPTSSGVASEQEDTRSSSPPLPPPPTQDPEIPVFVPSNYIEKVIAVYDYTADKEDELSFSENAMIYVIKKNDDGWWEGVLDGVTGLFPGNYVEPLM